MRGNIVRIELVDGRVQTAPDVLYQYDYGQRVLLTGVELPQAYEVHFATAERGRSLTVIGDATGADIPDELLTTGENIHLWIYLHAGEADGETEYHARIGVKGRARPTNQEPTPVQQDTITQAIAALNVAVEQTAADSADAGAARIAAETAQARAEAARNRAEAARDAAGRSETAAAASAGEARYFASEAADSAEAAQASETAAAISADHAEQAAARGGYLFFEIIDGDLIMNRTTNTEVDFELIDGDLYVRGVA